MSRNGNEKVNFNWEKKQAYVQVLVGCLLCIFLTGLFYVITFKRPSVLGLEVFTRSNSTKTAIALTSQALYGPFPTATGPTPTVTKTRTVTPSPTLTFTTTPSSTPFRFFIDTATPRTLVPHTGKTLPPAPTAVQINTPIPPTNPPIQPTSVPAQPTPCRNPQGHPIPCH
jgi:hypothetical protein